MGMTSSDSSTTAVLTTARTKDALTMNTLTHPTRLRMIRAKVLFVGFLVISPLVAQLLSIFVTA